MIWPLSFGQPFSMVILHIKVSPEVAKLSGCGYPRNGSREFEFSGPPKHFGQSWSLQTPHALAIRSSGVPDLLRANPASSSIYSTRASALAIQITDLVKWVSTMNRPRSNIARNRATKDRFVGIRTRIVSQLLEELLRVELPYRTADRSSEARSPG